MRKIAAVIRALTIFIGVSSSGFAGAAEIHVFSTGAPAQAAEIIGAIYSAATRDHVTFTVGQPAVIERRLASGESADLVLLPSRVIAMLNSSGALRAGSAVDLARVGIGVVVRDGDNRPDISSAAAIRQLLLNARSIVYPDPRAGGGFTGRAIERMIDQMGIADAVNAKLTRTSAIGGGVDLVAAGKAEVGLFNISEILPIKGATLVGPLPADMQKYIVFTAAIPASNAAPYAAESFIKVLAGPTARQAWQDAGLEPMPGTP